MKKHFAAFILALFVGAIYVGPDVYNTYTPGYQGIVMADSGDADFYFTVINKSYESRGLVRDPFHYEYRDSGNPFQYFPIEFVLGKVGKALGLRIDELAIAAEFFFPALLTLLLYAFAYGISGSRLTAIAVAAAMLLGTELVHPNGISNLFRNFIFRGEFSEFLSYSRPVNPQVSGLFFFAALGALLHLLRAPRSAWAIALAGVSVGILAYIYPYFWMFAFVALGVMGLYALAMRNWPLFFATCASGFVAALVMMPFLVANLSIFVHGGGSQLTQAIPTHRVIVEKVILLPLFLYSIIFLWGWWSRGRGVVGEWAAAFAQKYLFVLLLLIAGVIVSNHQVITGKLVFQQHFHFFTNIPMFVLAMTFLAMESLTLVPKVWRVLTVVALVVVCGWFALGVQVASYRAHSEDSARHQALAPMFAYLRAQGPGTVTLTNYYLATRLTIYTQGFTYMGGYDATFAVPKSQLVHDYFVMLALQGVAAGEVQTYLYGHRDEVGALLFIGTYWRDLCGSYGCFPDSVLDALVPQYQKFLSQPLSQTIKTHKIDFILWDFKMEPEWRLKGLITEPAVVESGDFKLYAIKK
ncbi:hypothetical protein A2943_00080 [Candidatus Adlerbacteria bacterium RIFCSPLOWO2_01_FULL_51_16]|uniref:Glycosyltransferase RgtA/B/C/D-like domain-containing protein n=1 Tax=Candidatus Adlerbacteria bacterium RIFCSPLOWO2_01_FULL_51_16 TaxID=1797243 RepID=A0A1F4XF31_9BACT|nr:MAG: hypothetical protein A2943_00080 [Candidatus Adlerbacteria bacterium RIFCSPLOWO2_01_FULL_51_16]